MSYHWSLERGGKHLPLCFRFEEAICCDEGTTQSSLRWTNQVTSEAPSKSCLPLSPFTILTTLLWTHFNSLMSFLHWNTPKLHSVLKVGLHLYSVESDNRLPLPDRWCLVLPWMCLAFLAVRTHCWLIVKSLSAQSLRSHSMGLLSSHSSPGMNVFAGVSMESSMCWSYMWLICKTEFLGNSMRIKSDV